MDRLSYPFLRFFVINTRQHHLLQCFRIFLTVVEKEGLSSWKEIDFSVVPFLYSLIYFDHSTSVSHFPLPQILCCMSCSHLHILSPRLLFLQPRGFSVQPALMLADMAVLLLCSECCVWWLLPIPWLWHIFAPFCDILWSLHGWIGVLV